MDRRRALALTLLSLSLLGCLTGLTWAGLAWSALDQDAQAAIGVVLGLALAAPCGVLAGLAGLALALDRSRPQAATMLLTVAGTGVLVVVLGLASVFGPTLL